MTLNQILYFQKIANLENYHQAAEELYISQPSLSRGDSDEGGEDVFGVRGPDSHRLPHRGRENAGDFDGWGKD